MEAAHTETTSLENGAIGREIVFVLLRSNPELDTMLTPPHTPFDQLGVATDRFLHELEQGFAPHFKDGEREILQERAKNRIRPGCTLEQVCMGIEVEIKTLFATA